jgi:hypothetical protein
MNTQPTEQELTESSRGVVERGRAGVSQALRQVPELASEARRRAGQVAERLPKAFGRARSGAQSTVTRLQTLPDSGLRLLAAVSLGFGAGLRLAGKRRLATLAGLAPASLLGFAILSRPRPAGPEPKPTQP